MEVLKQAMWKQQDLHSDWVICMSQVRVSVVGHAMRLVGNHMHFRAIQQ